MESCTMELNKQQQHTFLRLFRFHCVHEWKKRAFYRRPMKKQKFYKFIKKW